MNGSSHIILCLAQAQCLFRWIAIGRLQTLQTQHSEQTELLQHEASVYDGEMLMRYISVFSELSNRIRYATQKRVQTELTLIKLCCPQMESDEAALAD